MVHPSPRRAAERRGAAARGPQARRARATRVFATVAVLAGLPSFAGVGLAVADDALAEDGSSKRAGNRILTILGGRSRELVLLEKEMREVSDEL